MNDKLAEYRKNETPEQKAERIAKSSETRKERAKERRIIEEATRKAMKMKWKVPIFEDAIDDEGKPIKKQVGVKFMKTPELIAARLVKEATSDDSKNVVGAVKEIRDILGEKEPEQVNNNNIVVHFSNKEIDI